MPKYTIAIVVLIACFALMLPAFAHPGNGEGHRHRTGGIDNVRCNDGMIVISPAILWPPNHKLVTVDVVYIDNDKDGDAVSLAINSISSNQDAPDGTSECSNQEEQSETPGCKQDEPDDTSKCASSNGPDWIIGPTPVNATDPDSAATTVQLRAERCGNDGSRIYTISYLHRRRTRERRRPIPDGGCNRDRSPRPGASLTAGRAGVSCCRIG